MSLLTFGPRYSSVCESDPTLYAAYLSSYKDYLSKFGDVSAEEFVSFCRSVGGGSCGCGGVDVGGGFGRLVGCADGRSAVKVADVGSDGAVAGVGRCGSCVYGGVVGSAVGRSEGLERVGAGGSGSDAGSRSRDGVDSEGSVGKPEEREQGREPVEVSVDPLAGLVGRSRRKKKRALKKQGEESKSDVPLWRRGAPKSEVFSAPRSGAVREGFFSKCSDVVQKELRESRAAMLIAKNKAQQQKALAEARRVEGLIKSQTIERQVELKRINIDKRFKVAVEAKFGENHASGFAETVVENGLDSVISVPSLAGSVSPDSSVSVEMVARMEGALQRVAEENKELKLKVEKQAGFLRDFENRYDPRGPLGVNSAEAVAAEGFVPYSKRIPVSPASEYEALAAVAAQMNGDRESDNYDYDDY